MSLRFHIALLVLAVTLVGCRVWTDFGGPTADAGSDARTCAEDCGPAPWWNEDYSHRVRVTSQAEVSGEHPIVLPVVLEPGRVSPDDLRDDRDDLRVVVNGEEAPRELLTTNDGAMTVWVRFPTAPSREDTIHFYWGYPDATVPDSPWTDHVGAFHFEGNFGTSAPDDNGFNAIRDPAIVEDGRMGRAAEVPSWPGSLRLYDATLLQAGATTIAFSIRGRRGESDDRTVMRAHHECPYLDVDRTATRETTVIWVDPAACNETDPPEDRATVPVNVLDGAWHDVVLTVDYAGETLHLTVDDRHDSTPIPQGMEFTERLDLRGGTNDGSEDYYRFDELTIANFRRSPEEANVRIQAVRNELFVTGDVQER